jgi:hypothetical protein
VGDDNAWEGSFYHPDNAFNEATFVDQAGKLLGLSEALGLRGVRYAVSSVGGADFFRSVLLQHFPEQMRTGALAVYHVDMTGMP